MAWKSWVLIPIGLLVLASCQPKLRGVATLRVPWGDIDVSLDTEGQIQAGFSPKLNISLGPIGLSAAIEQTLNDVRNKRYYLIILWEDDSGIVQREEYEIGQSFSVSFRSQSWVVQEIKGDSGSVVVSVRRPASAGVTTQAPLPTTAPAVTQSPSVNWNEIEALLQQWDMVHASVDSTWDTSSLSTVLTGGALHQQEDTVRTLRQKDCRWDFTDLDSPKIAYQEMVSSAEVIVEVRKHWNADEYCKGVYQAANSFDTPFVMRYRIIRTSQGWRIVEKSVEDQ
jgi:hypothetical protein